MTDTALIVGSFAACAIVAFVLGCILTAAVLGACIGYMIKEKEKE